MLYRVTDTRSGIYAMQIKNVEDDIDSIESLLEEDYHVLLVTDLYDAAKVFNVDVSEITIVEPE